MVHPVVLKIEQVGKQFQILEGPSLDLKQSLANLLHLRFPSKKRFWALESISFTVRKGEVLGIVGRNGSGKSTLLKIISKITPPSTGRIEIYGKVNTLLEVGTGFHPELTGRENIFLNGSILGMDKADIRKKLDEIIDFAGVRAFIDTPVKHYSSGMYVRLAFSVAAHLEPDILIVDEVLSVGDAEFQQKCLKKMENEVMRGSTVLFVSHNMMAIQRLCHRVIWMEKGKCIMSGQPTEVIERYLESYEKAEQTFFPAPSFRNGNGSFRFENLIIRDKQELPIQILESGSSVKFELAYQIYTAQPENLSLFIHFRSAANQSVFSCTTIVQSTILQSRSGIVTCTFEKFPLNTGTYKVDLECFDNGELADQVLNASTFKVSAGFYYESGIQPHPWYKILVDYHWRQKSNLD